MSPLVPQRYEIQDLILITNCCSIPWQVGPCHGELCAVHGVTHCVTGKQNGVVRSNKTGCVPQFCELWLGCCFRSLSNCILCLCRLCTHWMGHLLCFLQIQLSRRLQGKLLLQLRQLHLQQHPPLLPPLLLMQLKLSWTDWINLVEHALIGSCAETAVATRWAGLLFIPIGSECWMCEVPCAGPSHHKQTLGSLGRSWLTYICPCAVCSLTSVPWNQCSLCLHSSRRKFNSNQIVSFHVSVFFCLLLPVVRVSRILFCSALSSLCCLCFFCVHVVELYHVSFGVVCRWFFIFWWRQCI